MNYEEIRHRQERIEILRSRLAILLGQQATLGNYAPPHIVTEIADIRISIGRIKNILIREGIETEDHPDDFAIAIEPPSRRVGERLVVYTPSAAYRGICTFERDGRTSIQFTDAGVSVLVTAASELFWEDHSYEH